MVDTNKLRGLLREKNITQAEAAKLAGISTSTMRRRLETGVFGTDEIDKLINAIGIESPERIFFVQNVT